MAYNTGLAATVGGYVQASQYNDLVNNADWMRGLLDVEHDFNVTTGDGSHKDITATGLELAGRLRATAPGSDPGAGVGLEYGYNTATGYGFLLAYDRDLSALKPLRFQNGAGAWDASGRLGVGTVTPAHPFHLEANPGAAGVPVAWLHNSGNVTGYDGVVISSVNDGDDAEVLHVRANTTSYSGGTSLMLVRGDGYTGFGTATPTTPFTVTRNPGAAGVPAVWLHNSGNVADYDGVVLSAINNGADAEILAVRTNNTAYNNGTLLLLVRGDGNVGFNGASNFGTSGAGVLGIANGTAPTTSPANMVQLWAEDVAASSELKVRDEAGNVTTLSPHNITLFTPDPQEPLPYMFYHENRRKGVRQQVDMTGLIRAVERLSGKQFIYTEAME